MDCLRLDRRVLRWGNAYGLRITKAEAEALGVEEGQLVHADVRVELPPLDLSKIKVMHLGGPEFSAKHTELANEEADADLRH
jgi:hypothetical protein